MQINKQECIPGDAYRPLVDCIPAYPVQEVSAWGCLPGGFLPRGVSARGVSAQGGSASGPGGVYPSMQWGRYPPPVDRQTPVKT